MFFILPATVAETEKWYNGIKSSRNRTDFTFVDENNIRLAMGGLTGMDGEHRNAEFYVMVNPDMHGNGIGKKVSRWMFNYGFSVLKLHKIFLYTNDNNVAAYKVYESAGFVLEGVLREHRWKNGVFQNRRFYGLLKSEWEGLTWMENIKDAF